MIALTIQTRWFKCCNYHYTLRTTYRTYARRCEQLPERVIRHCLKEIRFPRAGFISPNFNYVRAQCSLPANYVGSFLETAEGKRVPRRLQLWLSHEDCMEGPVSHRGAVACWARHRWLPGDTDLIAGNSIFRNRNGCAVVMFWGCVSRAEKDYFK